MNDQSNGSSPWAIEQTFSFESDSSLQEVVRSLGLLEEGGGFFSSSRHEISILPDDRDGYTFRYNMRRRNRGSSYTTASAEGEIWQEEDGPVVVEGTAQINPSNLYSSIGMIIFLNFVIGFVSGGFNILSMLFIGIGIYLVYSYYLDRNQMIDRIREAVRGGDSVSRRFQGKEKFASPPEKVKSTRLSAEEKKRPGSVWNQAISEYEDDEQDSADG